MKHDDEPNNWDSENEFEASFDGEGPPCEEEDFIYKTLLEIKYLEAEGFIRVFFHPNHPKDYLHAKLVWKSATENMKEIEHLMK